MIACLIMIRRLIATVVNLFYYLKFYDLLFTCIYVYIDIRKAALKSVEDEMKVMDHRDLSKELGYDYSIDFLKVSSVSLELRGN